MKLLSKHKNFESIIIGFGLVLFWRSIWGLLDKYLFPDNEILSYFLCLIVGIAVLYFNDSKLKELE